MRAAFGSASRTTVWAAAVAVFASLAPAAPAAASAVPLSPCEPSDHGYPVVSAVVFEPRVVDVRRSDAEVRVVVTTTDVGGPGPATGVASITAAFWGPGNGGPPITLEPTGDGTWVGVLHVPRGVAGGLWTIGRLFLRDVAGNERLYEDATRRFPSATVEVRSVKDKERPRIESFTLSRSSADTRSGPVRVGLRTTLSDDVGIPARFAVYGEAESSSDAVTSLDRDLKSYRLTRVSGGPRQGVWAGSVVMKRWDRPGPWFFGLNVVDRSGRWTSLDRSGLDMPPFRLTASKDDDDPRATGLTGSVSDVDVRGGDSSFTVSVRLRDATSGIARAGLTSADLTVAAGLRLVSGDRHDGVWRGTVKVPRCGTPAGSLRLRLRAFDRVGRSLAQRAAVTAQVLNGDTVDPHAVLQVPVDNGNLEVAFDEPVTGLTSSSAVVRGTPEEGAPYDITGTWTCKDSGGRATDCAGGAVLTATFTVAPGQPEPAYGYSVLLNPETTLGLTDLAGNAPRAATAVTS